MLSSAFGSIELCLATGACDTLTFCAPTGASAGPSVPGWIKDRTRPAAEAQIASFRAGMPAVASTDAGAR
jgi:hypothetical protein